MLLSGCCFWGLQVHITAYTHITLMGSDTTYTVLGYFLFFNIWTKNIQVDPSWASFYRQVFIWRTIIFEFPRQNQVSGKVLSTVALWPSLQYYYNGTDSRNELPLQSCLWLAQELDNPWVPQNKVIAPLNWEEPFEVVWVPYKDASCLAPGRTLSGTDWTETQTQDPYYLAWVHLGICSWG